jgi:hypothetical protein
MRNPNQSGDSSPFRIGVWLARKDSNLQSPDPESSGRMRGSSESVIPSGSRSVRGWIGVRSAALATERPDDDISSLFTEFKKCGEPPPPKPRPRRSGRLSADGSRPSCMHCPDRSGARLRRTARPRRRARTGTTVDRRKYRRGREVRLTSRSMGGRGYSTPCALRSAPRPLSGVSRYRDSDSMTSPSSSSARVPTRRISTRVRVSLPRRSAGGAPGTSSRGSHQPTTAWRG